MHSHSECARLHCRCHVFASPTVGVLIVSQLLKDAGVTSHAAAADAAAAAGGALHGIPVQQKGCMCVAHRASRCCYYSVLHPQQLMQVGSPCVWCRRWRHRCSRRVFDRPDHRCSARLTPLLSRLLFSSIAVNVFSSLSKSSDSATAATLYSCILLSLCKCRSREPLFF